MIGYVWMQLRWALPVVILMSILPLVGVGILQGGSLMMGSPARSQPISWHSWRIALSSLWRTVFFGVRSVSAPLRASCLNTYSSDMMDAAWKVKRN